jgi:hypothetical protein
MCRDEYEQVNAFRQRESRPLVDCQAVLIKNDEQVHCLFMEADMLEKFKTGMDDMALAIVIWLCTLPLVGLLVIPFFGLKVGLIVAVALFIAAMAICWGICGWKIFRD